MAKPFFSGNYGSALARVDTRPIVEAGKAQGQMYANLGKQVSGAIEKYGLNKEKQKENKATIKSSVGILERMKKLDPENETEYMMSIDQLNNEDMGLGMRAKLADKTLQGLSITSRLQGEMLNRDSQRQALGLAKQLEASTIEIANLKAEIAGKTKDSVISGVDADARAKTSQANILEVDDSYYKTDKALDRENKQSLIDYRNAASLSMLLKQNNINASVSEDLEKRFSEISTLLPKLDNTKIKVKTTGTFGTGFNAEEKEIPYSEYKENPDDYAPLVSDQLKGLQLQENTLKEELSQLTLSTPIPYTNNDTGVQGITTVREMLKFQKQSKNNTPSQPQSMPLGPEDMMMLDQPGTTIGVPQVPNFSR